MLQEVKVINPSGYEYPLVLTDPWEIGIAVVDITGIGPGKSNVNIVEHSTVDGGQATSSRRPVRYITLELRYLEAHTVEDARHRSYNMFPLGMGVRLEFTSDNRSSYIVGVTEEVDLDMFSKDSSVTITVVCADPNFYSMFGEQESKVSDIFPNFHFVYWNVPDTPETVFSYYGKRKESLVYYPGDVKIGMTINIEFLGRINEFKLYDAVTHGLFEINILKVEEMIRSDIVPGDEIFISTVRGHLYARFRRAGKDTNIMSCVTSRSEWFILNPGDNWYIYTTDGVDEHVNVVIKNRIAYGGI